MFLQGQWVANCLQRISEKNKEEGWEIAYTEAGGQHWKVCYHTTVDLKSLVSTGKFEVLYTVGEKTTPRIRFR